MQVIQGGVDGTGLSSGKQCSLGGLANDGVDRVVFSLVADTLRNFIYGKPERRMGKNSRDAPSALPEVQTWLPSRQKQVQ